MIIKFPTEAESLSPEEASFAHKLLSDDYFYLCKKQSKCELAYWKVLGYFFISVIGTLFLLDKGINLGFWDPLTTTAVAGLICLFVYPLIAKKDLEFTTQAAKCIEIGANIEKKHVNTGRIFRIYKEHQSYIYKAHLLMKAAPFGFVGICTLIAGTMLAGKVETWLAIFFAILFTLAIVVFSSLYTKLVKRAIFGVNRQALSID